MRKILLTALPLCLASLAASSQVQLRDADMFRLRGLSSPVSETNKASLAAASDRSGGRVDLIVRYGSPEALDEIRAKGGEIVSLVGTRTAIVSVLPEKASDIAASKGVTGARLSARVKRTNNKALPFSNVPDVHLGKGLDKPYDGSGVVIGLFDTGIDPNHINFRDADGKTRVKLALEYVGQSAKPEVYDTPEKIARFTTDDPQESHGTHVLGCAAGSFRDESDPTAPDYRGVAPGADLVVCGGPCYNAQILDGIERIGKYAQSQGKPCVINLSLGDNLGPHDGTDEFTEAINDIAEKYDILICLSAGNERDLPISIIKELTEEDPYVKTLALKGLEEQDNMFQSFGTVEIWTQDGTPFEVSLDIISRTAPDEVLYSFKIPVGKGGYVASGNTIDQFIDTSRLNVVRSGTKFHEVYKNCFMGGVAGVDPYNRRYMAELNLYLVASSVANATRNFTRITVKGQPGKKIFMYCLSDNMSFGSRNIPGIDVPDGAGTNSNMGSGPNTLAVGSYCSANVPDSGYEEGTIGEISYFSSFGETPDGRTMPDVCAPGQVVISSRNSYFPTSGSYADYYPVEYSYKETASKKTYNWTSCAGTSQSSPHMAGITALWRQADPSLTFSDLQEIARETAATPASNAKGWGHGKADAMAGIRRILDSSSVYDILETAPESIMLESVGNGCFNIYAPGQEALSAEVYTLQGVKVAGGASQTETLSLDASQLPAGVYVLRVNGSHSTRTIKFAKN